MAHWYCKYLQIHCQQWHVFTHLPEKPVCLGPARGNNGLAVLHQGDWVPGPKARELRYFGETTTFPKSEAEGHSSVITMVKAEVGGQESPALGGLGHQSLVTH